MVTLFLRRSAFALSVGGGPLALALERPSPILKSATYEVKNLQGTDFRKFYKKPKFTIIFSSAHSNFHQNLTVGSKDLLHIANSDF